MIERFSRNPLPHVRASIRHLFRTAVAGTWLLSACEVLEADISDRRVRIVGPAECAEVRAGAVAFRWEALPGASGYTLTVASPAFDDGHLVADTTLRADTLGSRRYGCSLRLEAGSYEWSVAAFNSGYETCAEVRRLTVLPDREMSDGEPEAAQTVRP